MLVPCVYVLWSVLSCCGGFAKDEEELVMMRCQCAGVV